MQDATQNATEARTGTGHPAAPVPAKRPLAAVHDLVIREGGWRAAANAAGIGVAKLAATACGLSSCGERAVAATDPGHQTMPRWRRWIRNAADTAAMAVAFPVVLGYSGTKHRAVWQIPAVQAIPVVVIAGFFAAGALAAADLSDIRVGEESFWMWRVGAGMALAITGLYASGTAARFAVESRPAARAALLAAAALVAAFAAVPFSNAVMDITAENRATEAAFAASAKRHAEIAARAKAEPGYNPLPAQRAAQRDLLVATRQDVPAHLQSDEAYADHLRRCFRGGPAQPGCGVQADAKAGRLLKGTEIVTALWQRQWR